jgi:hypothetical protein
MAIVVAEEDIKAVIEMLDDCWYCECGSGGGMDEATKILKGMLND